MANPLTLEDVRERQATDACVIRSGETVVVAQTFDADSLTGCSFEPDSSLIFYGEEAPGVSPTPAENPIPDAGVLEEPMSGPLELPMDAGVPDVKAVVEQAVPHLADFSQLPKDPSGMGVVMAVVAVAGGGTAWKFYNDYSKRKHEENMARIENDKSKSDDHTQCAASRAALELKVAGLESTISHMQAAMESVKKEQSSMSASVGNPAVDELKEKIEELEKLLKPKKGKKA